MEELFAYFDLNDDSYSEPPQISLNDGLTYRNGLIDSELHDILMRIYSQIREIE